MQHFPIFLSTRRQRIVVSGGAEAALAKLRLILKTEAEVTVFARTPDPVIADWARAGRLTLHRRALVAGDVNGAVLFYAADEDGDEDARTAAIARAEGALVNIVDNLQDSAFITPAIVDRDPVTVAIGTEGAAPVLARALKRDLEERLPASLGLLARIGKAFRPLAEALPMGRKRRDFWAEYYFTAGPDALAAKGEEGVAHALPDLLARHLHTAGAIGQVVFVGAGPGDPELLTLKARKALDTADVVLHDRLVAAPILELARREATIIETGKTGFAPSMPQDRINALMVKHARAGAQVVRLKSGDPTLFGRLDEETAALEACSVSWSVVPGITAASAAAASIGQSQTRRGRNSTLRYITGHDMNGFAEQDWATLAHPDAAAAIYMGKKSARFLQGRLMMHGRAPDTPLCVVENVSRPNQQVLATTLASLPETVAKAKGPALIFLGIAPHHALHGAQPMEHVL